MRIFRIIFFTFIVITVVGNDTYSFVYSVVNHSYIQDRELYLVEESNLINEQLIHYATSDGSTVYRKRITRSIGMGYYYEIDTNAMINQCENIMKGMEWNLEEKYDKKQIDERVMVFKKKGYMCEITFFLDKNSFRVMLRTDDIYRTLSM